MRALIHLLSLELFGRSIALPDFPHRPELIGFGLSDWEVYARGLAASLGYINTFYHTSPRLDISDIPDELVATADFLIATDVMEHVLAPVSLAFLGARRLLREGGVFVFSVPFHVREGPTIEHFPNLENYAVSLETDGVYRLRNHRADGVEEVFDDLVFHGGPGSTLEMRVFSLQSLLAEFNDAGFSDVRVCGSDEPQWGIYWRSPFSVPLVARA
jgi:SAM-dependent methyltransferase